MAARRLAGLLLPLVALPGCSSFDPASRPIDDGITVLAKVDGFGPPLAADEGSDDLYATLRIADGEDAARVVWADLVPPGLPERSGDPREAGRYGSLDDVDLEEQVLAVYSSGQSSSCPGWLGDVSVQDGEVELEERRHMPGGGCTSDHNPYYLVLAVDRDKVPAATELPTEAVVDEDLSGLITVYPAG